MFYKVKFLVIIASLMSFSAIALEPIKRQNVLEVVIFTVKKHTSSNLTQQLASAITPCLKKYPGFISREFAKNPAVRGQYIDIVKWKTLADANTASSSIISNNEMKRFLSIMQSYRMYHFNLSLLYEPRNHRFSGRCKGGYK